MLFRTQSGGLTTDHDGHRLARMLLPAVGAIACLAVMASDLAHFPLPWTQISRIETNVGPPALIRAGSVAFVERHTRPGEPVLLLSAPDTTSRISQTS
jgi:hypothetical protein